MEPFDLKISRVRLLQIVRDFFIRIIYLAKDTCTVWVCMIGMD